MSFLHNPEIYKTIVDRVLKNAQAAPRDLDVNAVAKKLSNNLSRELNAASPAENITSVGDAGVTIDDLSSLQNLLQFLSSNKLKINDKQIAYSKDEATALADSSNLSEINGFYVDVPLLSRYVNHLQEKSKADSDALLQTSVGNLIDQVNEIIPNSGLSKNQEKSTPESPNALPDTTVVDKFEKKIFDPQHPMANSGNINPLQVKDLKNAGTLNAWLRNGDSFVVMDGKNVPFMDESANRCIVPQVLYKRALQFYNTGNEDERRIYSFYMKAVQAVAGQFTGPDNSACTIEGVAGADKKPTSTSNPGPADANILIQSVPLRMRDMSFQRINYFFDQYQKFFGAKRGAGVQTAITNAKKAMADIQNPQNFLINSGMDVFNLNASPEEVKTWLKPPQGKYYLAFLDHLESVLANTGYVIRDLQTAYGDDDKLDSNLKNILGQQIGYGSGSGSIYGNNFNQIMRLKSLVKI